MREVISEQDLQDRISKLASIINNDEFNLKKPVVFVGILNGAFMFFSDLVKKINLPIEIDFVRVKSYEGQNRKEIKLTKDLETSIKGKHVYLVDDIIDSGHTMKFLMDKFLERGAIHVTPIATIFKENVVIQDALCILRYPQDSPWFVGYGMDNEDGTGRNINTILELDGK
jgi:hypoxanthine phosphoribosyltransferase